MATKRTFTVALLLGTTILAGCNRARGTSDGDDESESTATERRRHHHDAGTGSADAGTGTPDAGIGTPDAGTGTPDAGTGTPDAGTGTPDAGTGTPDAGIGTPVPITPPIYPTAHPRIYLTSNRARLSAALSANTAAASRFKATANLWLAGGDVYNFSPWNAALLGQLTGNTAYCTKAVSTVEAQVVAAEAKIAANQAPLVAGDSYLEIGNMIGDVALVYDWCFNQTTSGQRTRWLKYANQAVWNVWHHDTAKWGSATIPWTGWSVNDPSDNYYYSFLRATMLLGLASKGEDPQADAWITQFHDTKITQQLVPTFNADLVGGGSREGSGYGVAMRRLFELYDLWTSTTGENIALMTPHTRQSMLAMLHQLVPTRDRVSPTGDLSRDSTAAFFDYHRNYLQELIQVFPTDLLARRTKTQLMASSLPVMGSSFMFVYDFMYDNSNVTAQPIDGLNTTYYAPGIGEVYARSGWDTHATWVNLIAGPYTQSHAHQDQGSLMIYKDGWLAYDAVIESHSGLTQDTTAHGLVRITSGGQSVRQIASTISKLTALHQGVGYTHAAADLTPAYNGNAAVQKVQREMVYLQPDVVVVFDRIQSAGGTSQTWQLVSPVAASISGATATITNAGHALKVQKISGGTMSVTSMTSIDSDYSSGFRLDETMPGGDNRYLHVLSIDGSVSSTATAGDATHPGVTVNFSNGHSATVTFTRDTAGATLVLDGVTKVLGAGLDQLPE
ncbi:MAG TPA: hypothetical protein VK601_23475 [Kofleriaceae bacterium]|nr:hypothetical protein [Kofleriaceae bacterium]